MAAAYLLFASVIAVGAVLAMHRSPRLAGQRDSMALADKGPVDKALAPKPAARARYAVIIVLDGARPGYFNLVPMPHLRALMRQGVTYSHAFVGQELANTPPGHATIGTGDFPKHHGVEGFLWQNPQTNQMIDPSQTGAVLNGALERVISEHHVPSLAGAVKRTYPRAQVVSVAGHKCYASDAMGTPAADDILCALIYHHRWVAQAVGQHRPPPGAINNPHWDVPIPPRTAGFGPAVQQWTVGTENDWTMHYALWAFHRIHYPRVLMMNLAETDVLGHFAPNTKVMAVLMRRFDVLLGHLINAYRRAGILSQTDFVITADHGMAHIHSFMPYHVLTQAVTDAGATAVYIEHDTAAAIGLTDLHKSQVVALNLFRLGGSEVDATYYKVYQHGQWFYKLAAAQPNVPKSLQHAYLTLADTMAANSGPDVFAVFAPNVSTRNFSAYGYPWRAGHLGPQWADQHIPLILAGAGIKKGVTSSYPARLVDIAPTLEHLLGTRSGRVDGVVLVNALEHPARDAVAVQQTRGRQLRPIVRAIRQRRH